MITSSKNDPHFFSCWVWCPTSRHFQSTLLPPTLVYWNKNKAGKKKRHKQRNNTKLSPKTRSNHRVDPVCQNCLLEAAEPRGWQFKVGKNDALQKTTNIASEIKKRTCKIANVKRNRWTGEQNWNVNNRLSVWSRCIRAKTFFFAMCFCDAWLWMGMGMDPVPASLPAICYHLPISRIKVANWSMKSPRHIHWHCTDINHGKSWLHLPRPSIFRRFKQTKNSTTEKKTHWTAWKT